MAGKLSRLIVGNEGVSLALLMYGDGERSVSSEPPGGPHTASTETVLLYPPTRAPQNVTYHGGLLGGGLPGGLPVQLIFWGNWWDTTGAGLRTGLEDAVKTLIQSPYFDRLDQYRVVPHPTYRDPSMTVTNPAPPASYSGDDAMKMILALIDDDKLPEPDDEGGRIGYFVMMPGGTTLKPDGGAVTNPSGAHSYITEKDFPGLDWDNSWVAWINNNNLDQMTSTFSHELVEMLTDPELDGWYVNNVPTDYSEIGDLCDVQPGWVDGVFVRSYWSATDDACVIPTRPLSVRLDGVIRTTAEKQVASGDYSPPPAEGLGHFVAACQLEKNKYPWTLTQHVEQAELEATPNGFHTPTFLWYVGGESVEPGISKIEPSLDVTELTINGPVGSHRFVNLTVNMQGAKLTITNDSEVANFDVPVEVIVGEGPTPQATPAQALNGKRTATVPVPFIGAVAMIGGTYDDDLKRCQAGTLEVWKETHPGNKEHVHGPGPGPRKDGDERMLTLPAWIDPVTVGSLRSVLKQADVISATDRNAGDEFRRLTFQGAGVVDPGQREEGVR